MGRCQQVPQETNCGYSDLANITYLHRSVPQSNKEFVQFYGSSDKGKCEVFDEDELPVSDL